jgi:rubrerythrin
MLISKEVIITWNNSTKHYYENLGYIFTKQHDKFIVKVDHLHTSSNVMVKVQCDYCGKEKSIQYNTYNRGMDIINKWSCKECGYLKKRDIIDKKQELKLLTPANRNILGIKRTELNG